MMNRAIWLAIIFAAGPSAFAQVDTTGIRSKLAVPMDRKTFTVRAGIEMVVDYGPSKQVCRIQLPSGEQIVGTVPSGAITKAQIEEVLDEVVPPSVRGKEVNRVTTGIGALAFFLAEYEHVSISEGKNGAVGTGITVTFKDPACMRLKAQ